MGNSKKCMFNHVHPSHLVRFCECLDIHHGSTATGTPAAARTAGCAAARLALGARVERTGRGQRAMLRNAWGSVESEFFVVLKDQKDQKSHDWQLLILNTNKLIL